MAETVHKMDTMIAGQVAIVKSIGALQKTIVKALSR